MTLVSKNQNLKSLKEHDAIHSTHLGQAHLAGTGPNGKTCRECRFWHNNKPTGDLHHGEQQTRPYHEREALSDGGELKPSLCNYEIMNKAHRRVPHDAKACRFFSQSETPPEIYKEKRGCAK